MEFFFITVCGYLLIIFSTLGAGTSLLDVGVGKYGDGRGSTLGAGALVVVGRIGRFGCGKGGFGVIWRKMLATVFAMGPVVIPQLIK